MKKHTLFITIASLIIILAACVPPAPTINHQNFSGQAVNADGKAYSGSAGTLHIDIAGTMQKVGTIQADGTFNVTLPETIAANALQAAFATTPEACANLISEGRDAKSYQADIVIMDAAGKEQGKLWQGVLPSDGTTVTSTVVRTFFDKAATAKGSCEPNASTISELDIKVKNDWNLLSVEMSQAGDKTKTKQMSISEAADNVVFFYQAPAPKYNAYSGKAVNADGKIYSGSAGTLHIDIAGTMQKVGAIEADGTFSVTLPETIAANALQAAFATTPEACANLISEGRDAKSYQADIVIMDTSGKEQGKLFQGVLPSDGTTVTSTVVRTFFDKAATAKGSCEPNASTIAELDIKVKNDWNLLSVEMSQANGKMKTKQMSISEVADNVVFFYQAPAPKYNAYSGKAVNTDGKTYSGSAGTLHIDIAGTMQKVGAIEADGTFSITLPETIAANALQAAFATTPEACANLISEGRDAKSYQADIVIMDTSGKEQGKLFQGVLPSDGTTITSTVVRTFFDKAATAKGSCEPNASTISELDIKVKNDWNLLSVEMSQAGDKTKTKQMSIREVADNVVFFYQAPAPTPKKHNEFSGTVVNMNGQAYSGPAASLRVALPTGLVEVGTIAKDGKFSVTLPETIAATALQPAFPNTLPAPCLERVTKGKDAKQYLANILLYNAAGETVGMLMQGILPTPGQRSMVVVTRSFFDKAAIAQGICEPNAQSISDMDISVAAGWNIALVENKPENGKFKSTLRTISAIPSNVVFYYFPLQQ